MCLGDAIKTHKKKFRNDVYENAAMRGDEDTIIEPFIVRIYWIVFFSLVTRRRRRTTTQQKFVQHTNFPSILLYSVFLFRLVDTIYTLSEIENNQRRHDWIGRGFDLLW